MNGIISIPVRQTLYNRDCTITIAVGGTEEEKRLFHSVFSYSSCSVGEKGDYRQRRVARVIATRNGNGTRRSTGISIHLAKLQ
jgi:hypothetical protein